MTKQNLHNLILPLAASNSDIPSIIPDNLNPKFPLRPYQKEAFTLFAAFFEQEFEGKPSRPYHLNYNMATGSGKTLIMAGLMLYLYEKGYRRFIFFVNSTNIIEKTKDNFLNFASSKYLFSDKIHGKYAQFTIKHTPNFNEADDDNINVLFTTIQKLHSDLTIPKENGLTPEDFEKQKIVFIADEAHHINAATRKGAPMQEDSWENTVMDIFNRNKDNILLEFSATMDLEHVEIRKKYADKIIFQYDLKQFRLAGYSKEINLLRSNSTQKERILQALILNQYRESVAAKHGIQLKPVILFKAHRTIAESNRNMAFFHQLIDALTVDDLKQIHVKTRENVLKKAFSFFEKNGIDWVQLKTKIQNRFQPANCISANNEAEKEKNQLILNSLEDETNPVRAVFAVQKLNEGWDVLNLYDIVRLYDNSAKKTEKLNKTTVSEAQLIGRGARYFPFIINDQQNLFTRKYDDDLDNELRILEELHYHTIDDNRFIEELKKALIRTGIYEDERDFVERRLELKQEFVKSEFYRKGFVVLNEKIRRDFTEIKSLEAYNLPAVNEISLDENAKKSTVIPMKNIQKHVIRRSLADNPFFRFDNLHHYFPNIQSITNFIEDDNYLNGINLTVKSDKKRFSNEDLRDVLAEYLMGIEKVIRQAATEKVGSKAFKLHPLKEVFTDKTVRIHKKRIWAEAIEKAITNKEYYIYKQFFGNVSQKEYILSFAKSYELFKRYFDEIYLILNENNVKFHAFDSDKTLIPDFVLILRRKKEANQISQFFVTMPDKEPENPEEMSLQLLTSILSGKKRDIAVVINNYTEDEKLIDSYSAFFPHKF